jgi:hypothetical protein
MNQAQTTLQQRIVSDCQNLKNRIRHLSKDCNVQLSEIVYQPPRLPCIWNLYYHNSKKAERLIVEHHRDCKILANGETNISDPMLERGFSGDFLPPISHDINDIDYILQELNGTSRFIQAVHKDKSNYQSLQFHFTFFRGNDMSIEFNEGVTMYLNVQRFRDALFKGKISSPGANLGGTTSKTTEYEFALVEEQWKLHYAWVDRTLFKHTEHFL